ncbi:MAG TPA: TPM domain-containing protein [Chlorobaculum sp.]|nr:TPM domain-containing protein [Chlorobaculum sp.]
MKDIVQKFLTAAGRLAVENRVKSAESGTSGEIVVMAVSSSSTYPAATLAGSGALSLTFAIIASLVLSNDSLWLFITIFAPSFIAMHELVRRVPFLKRPFISRKAMAEEVEEAAIKAFYLRKVHETRDRTGILIYISLFEHSVQVLADTGIDSKVGKHLWREVVDTITDGIRKGRPAEAICTAVDRCGVMLQLHFPRKADDRNELGDAMIIGQ